MRKIIVFAVITIGLASWQIEQHQVPYLSTTLSPYSEALSLVPEGFPKALIQIETYAKLETGLEDFLIYAGTGKQGETPFYWIRTESSLGGKFELRSMKKDESMNLCRDTIKSTFNGDSLMIAFEMIHHLTTNEIQYVWLDENNNRSETIIVISLDHPLKEGKNFPDLAVEQLNGEKLFFNDFAGKYVIVNWWHPACAPCIAEMPGFNKLVEQYKENPNVVFIAIAHCEKKDLTRFLENRKFDYIQTLANEDAVKLFKEGYPVNLIIDSEGIIRHFSSGGNEGRYLEIDKILKGLLE